MSVELVAAAADRLIGSADVEPFRWHRRALQRPILITADHAGRRFPQALGTLGLSGERLETHIRWDIGSRRLAKHLADRLQADLILANYSRLVVDLNRSPSDPTFIIETSDGVRVPGNTGIAAEEREARTAEIWRPYHAAIDGWIGEYRNHIGITPAIIAVHTFTPFMSGNDRPWQVGILWDRDPRIPQPLLAALEAAAVCVGDNEPYSGRHTCDYTMDHHAELAGLPYVSLETRQDLVLDDAGVAHWGDMLADALAPILNTPALYTVFDEA